MVQSSMPSSSLLGDNNNNNNNNNNNINDDEEEGTGTSSVGWSSGGNHDYGSMNTNTTTANENFNIDNNDNNDNDNASRRSISSIINEAESLRRQTSSTAGTGGFVSDKSSTATNSNHNNHNHTRIDSSSSFSESVFSISTSNRSVVRRSGGTPTASASANTDGTITDDSGGISVRVGDATGGVGSGGGLFDTTYNNVEEQQELLDNEIEGRIDTISQLLALNPTSSTMNNNGNTQSQSQLLQRQDSFYPTITTTTEYVPSSASNINNSNDPSSLLYNNDAYSIYSNTPLQHIAASNTTNPVSNSNNNNNNNLFLGGNNNSNNNNNNNILANNGEANIAFQCGLRLAAASYKYGCVGYRIEAFMVKLLEVYGYNCTVVVNNTELIASIFSYTKPVTTISSHRHNHRHNRRRRRRRQQQQQQRKKDSSSSSSSSDDDDDCKDHDDDDGVGTTITGLTTAACTTTAVLTTNADGSGMDDIDDFFSVDDDDDDEDDDDDDDDDGADIDDDEDNDTIQSYVLEEEHFLPITISIPLNYGEDLFKLGKLSDVCHNILYNSLSLLSAMNQLDKIDNLEPQWNTITRLIAYVGTSVGYAFILRGNWNDVLLSFIGSSITWYIIELFTLYAPYDTIRRLHNTWQNFCCAFFPALLASIVDRFGLLYGTINVNTVIISCIISELPGLGIKKGISELARGRILAGLSHVIGAVFTSFWLGLGGWIGVALVSSFDDSCWTCTINHMINNSDTNSSTNTFIASMFHNDTTNFTGSIKVLHEHITKNQNITNITIANITSGLKSLHNDLVSSSSGYSNYTNFTQNEDYGGDPNAGGNDLYNDADHHRNVNISLDWYFVFAPMLCLCFPIYFKVGHNETMPAFFVSLLSLSMTFIISNFNNAMLGSFVAAFITSLAAHIWSRGYHGCYCFMSRRWIPVYNQHRYGKMDVPPYRPESIVGIPAFFALAGGSLGFRGSFGLLVGDTTTGESAFQQMLVLTLTLVLGVYVGETIIPSKAVLNAW